MRRHLVPSRTTKKFVVRRMGKQCTTTTQARCGHRSLKITTYWQVPFPCGVDSVILRANWEISQTLSETGPSDATLYDLFSAETGRVREIRVTTLPAIQALHVFDDCRTDESGGKHPNHAVVAICRELKPESLSKDSPEYLEIRDELVKLFKQNIEWALPQANRA